MLRCDRMAPLGIPVVPEVKNRRAGSSHDAGSTGSRCSGAPRMNAESGSNGSGGSSSPTMSHRFTEGTFPARVNEDPFFRDDERAALRDSAGLEIEPRGERTDDGYLLNADDPPPPLSAHVWDDGPDDPRDA